jgi:hypothetical protein
MMSTSTSETNYLCKLSELGGKGGRRKCGAIVGNVCLRNHPIVATHQLEVFFRINGLMCIQTGLEFDLDEP